MGFWSELHRRNVFRVAAVYLVTAWLVMQVVSVSMGALDLPGWFDGAAFVFLAIGFPIALVIAWAFELTPEGVKHTEAEAGAPPSRLAALDIILIAAVVVLAGASVFQALRPRPATEIGASTSAGADPLSIAVLPFVNMSSDPEQEYFSDGLSEELLNQLAQLEDLRVIARTSSFAFKGRNADVREIADALGVRNVLEGSVRKAGDRLRITAQLVDASNGAHVWSQTYDRELADVFAIQDEIARSVTDSLSIALGVSERQEDVGRTDDPEAYDLFLRARFWLHQNTIEGGRRAVELYREAIAKDPDFALAWIELSRAIELASIGAPNNADMIAQARDAVDRALAMAPEMWEAHRERARQFLADREWRAAERAVARARELAPPSEWPCIDATLLPLRGGPKEVAVACAFAQREADPLSLEASAGLIISLEEAGREAEAFDEYERSQDLVGNRYFIEMFGVMLAWRTQDPALIDRHMHSLASVGAQPPPWLGQVIDAGDDRDAALEALRAAALNPLLQRADLQGFFAIWLAHYGDAESAAQALRRAGRRPEPALLNVLWLHDLAEARRSPEFKEIVRDIGLVDHWRETGQWGDFCRPLGDDDFECF